MVPAPRLMEEGVQGTKAIAKDSCSSWCYDPASTPGPGLSPREGPQWVGEELGLPDVGLRAWVLAPTRHPLGKAGLSPLFPCKERGPARGRVPRNQVRGTEGPELMPSPMGAWEEG